MKKNKLISGIMILLFIIGCSVGVNKDFGTGLKVSNSGLSLDGTALIVNKEKISTNVFALNTEVTFLASGVKGFVEKEGKVFLGASLAITDEQNKTMYETPDLFAAYDETGVSPKDAENLSVSMTPKDPMKAGSKYFWKTRIWDKNGKGEITSEMEFTVK